MSFFVRKISLMVNQPYRIWRLGTKAYYFFKTDFQVKNSNGMLSILFTNNSKYCASLMTRSLMMTRGRVQCFSMQDVMNKYFLLNSDKTFVADPYYCFREKRKKKRTLYLRNMT